MQKSQGDFRVEHISLASAGKHRGKAGHGGPSKKPLRGLASPLAPGLSIKERMAP